MSAWLSFSIAAIGSSVLCGTVALVGLALLQRITGNASSDP